MNRTRLFWHSVLVSIKKSPFKFLENQLKVWKTKNLLKGGTMKSAFLIAIAVLVFSAFLTSNLRAEGIVTCNCGYTSGGNCLPCNKMDSGSTDHPEGTIRCPCGYGAGNSCIPCQKDKDNPERGSGIISCRCGYSAGGSCLPCKK